MSRRSPSAAITGMTICYPLRRPECVTRSVPIGSDSNRLRGRNHRRGTMTHMAYRELPPPPELAGVVRCLWVREAAVDDDVLVTPDGCVDVVVRDGRATVAGPDTAPVSVLVPAGTVSVGARF